MKKTVAIVGIGLIGGSLGQALKRSGRYHVLGIARRSATLRDGKRRRAIDEGSLEFSAAAAADIIVIATPVALIVPTFAALAPHLGPGTVVTDVGSVKGAVMSGIAKIKAPHVRFVGSHPLAGSHRTGVNAASPDLFRGSTCVIVGEASAARRDVEQMWKTAGARPMRLKAADHDRVVAMTSHLPHLIAHALVHAAAGSRDWSIAKQLIAGSFRDVTRVASSDPDQWVQIFQANEPAVRDAVGRFVDVMTRLDRSVSSRQLASLLRRSSSIRKPLFRRA